MSWVLDRVTSHRGVRILGEGWPLALIFFTWTLLLQTECRKGQGKTWRRGLFLLSPGSN